MLTFLANLSIRSKFVTAFAAMLLLVAVLGLYAIGTLASLKSSFGRLENSVTSVQPLQRMGADAEALVQLCAETHVMVDPDQIKDIPDAAAQHQNLLAQEATVEQDFTDAWNAYSPTMDPGRETADGQAVDNAFTAISQAAAQQAIADQGNDNSVGARLVLVTIQQQLAALRTAMQDDLAYQKAQNSGLDNAAKSAAGFAILCCAALLGLIILGTVVVGFAMIRSISAPITGLTGVMNRLAARDFSASIPGLGRRDEIGSMAKAVQVFKENGQQRQKLEAEAAAFQKNLDQQLRDTKTAFEAAAAEQKLVVDGLAAALAALARGDLTVRFTQTVTSAYETLKTDFNKALEGLQDTIRAIAANITGVKTGASEINRAADDLSKRTEQQAAALEETAAALDEITATVKRAADGAKQARDLAANAKSDAERSSEVVRDMVGAMNGIETSSKQIGNIIGVIDEIAFQTNLLALNAGVEAARAGDAGRGFAVVATEVRALAQRSAEAAKEIKSLISASGEQVEGGVKLVGETGKTLSRIAEQVAQLNAVVVDIAASAQEQATGLTEVNTAVNQMDQVTQRNAAMVEQTTAASGALAGEAQQLAQLIARFQVGAAATPTPQAAPPRRAAPAPAPAAKPAPAGRAAISDLAASSKRAASGGGVAESSQDWSEF